MRFYNYAILVVLLFIVSKHSNAQNWRVMLETGATHYFKSDFSRLGTSTIISISFLDEELCEVRESEGLSEYTYKYEYKVSPDLGIRFEKDISPAFWISLGIGGRYLQFRQDNFESRPLWDTFEEVSVDTALCTPNNPLPPSFDPCDAFTNTYSDASGQADNRASKLIYLTVPIRLYHKFFDEKLGIGAGAAFGTTLFSNYRTYTVYTEHEIIDGEKICTYVPESNDNKSGNLFRDLTVQAQFAVNYNLNQRWRCEVIAVKQLSNIFGPLYSGPFGTNAFAQEARPFGLSVMMAYRLH